MIKTSKHFFWMLMRNTFGFELSGKIGETKIGPWNWQLHMPIQLEDRWKSLTNRHSPTAFHKKYSSRDNISLNGLKWKLPRKRFNFNIQVNNNICLNVYISLQIHLLLILLPVDNLVWKIFYHLINRVAQNSATACIPWQS